MSEISISVILPYYQAEWCITQALESLANQSITPKEIVCINDGSTDRGPEIVEQYRTRFKDSDFIHIQHENQGLGYSRNAGLNKVTSSHVAWLDADDIFLPHKIEQCLNAIHSETSWLVHQATEWDGEKQGVKRWLQCMENYEDLLIKGSPYLPSCTVLATTLAKKYPLHTDKSMHGTEDLDLWIRLYRDNLRPTCLKESLSLYRIHPKAMSQDMERHLERTKLCWQKNDIPESLQSAALSRKKYEMARVAHRRGEHQKAAVYYRETNDQSLKKYVGQVLNYLKIKI